MLHQSAPHGLIALPLLKRIAGAIAVFEKGQRAVRKAMLDKIRDDGFLVFDRGVVPIQLFVYRNAAVARDGIAFDQCDSPPFSVFVAHCRKRAAFAENLKILCPISHPDLSILSLQNSYSTDHIVTYAATVRKIKYGEAYRPPHVLKVRIPVLRAPLFRPAAAGFRPADRGCWRRDPPCRNA